MDGRFFEGEGDVGMFVVSEEAYGKRSKMSERVGMIEGAVC